MVKNRISRREKGVSLIELILVILLISILASIAVLNYSDLQTQTTADLVSADLKVLRAAVRAYYMKYPDYPANLDALKNSGYINEIPKDKFSTDNNYLYSPGTSTTDCKIWSRGPNGIDESGAGDDVLLRFGP